MSNSIASLAACGDCGKLFLARLDDNGRIGEEVNAFLDQHHIDAADPAILLTAYCLQCGAEHFGIVVGDAGYKGVRIALIDHHRAEVVRLAQQVTCQAERDSSALATLIKDLGILGTLGRLVGVNGVRRVVEAELLCLRLDLVRPSQQDGMSDAFGSEGVGGADDLGMLPFGKYQPLRRLLGFLFHGA